MRRGTRGRAGTHPQDGWMDSSMPRQGSRSCLSSVALVPQGVHELCALLR